MKKTIIILAILHSSMCSFATLRLPAVFTDNMVIQQNKSNPVWGWANPGEKITVKFNNNKYTTVASAAGEWKINLSPLKANSSGDIIVQSENETKQIKNVITGEVWLCSGQSNMEFTMSSFTSFYKDEIQQCKDEHIRFVVIQSNFNNKEKSDAALRMAWTTVNPETIGGCSAVAYFFAKALRKKLGVPVGLVISSWGGTPAQSWVDENTIRNFPAYADRYENAVKKINFDKIEEAKESFAATYNTAKANISAGFNKYTSADFNDSGWEKVNLPGFWEDAGHPDMDGIGVYRLSFTVNNNDAGKQAMLYLPAIDDADSTYINGTLVGTLKIWNEPRKYNIPGGLLKSGKNIMTIWVEDTGGAGGLINERDKFYIEIEGKKTMLAGPATFNPLLALQTISDGVNYNSLQNEPGVLFNAMIAPLLNEQFAGVIWYQGESNTGNYKEYRTLFPSLINCWRNRFQQKDLPFLFVQLSSFNPSGVEPRISDWAGLREAQTYALKLPKTGMAVTTDVGDEKDIHPKRKKEVGERLAAQAFNKIYGFTREICSGPEFSLYKTEGNTISIQFTNTGKGLMHTGDTLMGFMIAGKDKQFVPATAKIINDQVQVSGEGITSPVYVRYAWANSPLAANLYNGEGFPAVPFRTDKDEE